MAEATDTAESEAPAPRTRDPEQTRRGILDAAFAEFAAKGLSGARVDEIAARTRTTKRMIYYYFGSKEGLYAAVLEEHYGGIRDSERALGLDDLSATEALRRLVELTFDYHADHPEFVRLVAVENIHEARHVKASPSIPRRNAGIIRTISTLLARGGDEGVFRRGLDPLELHMLISGFCFYRVSNRHTLGAIFGRDIADGQQRAAQKRMIVEAVLRYVSP
jgi:AcrR family transcriptional regulator